MQSSTNVVEYGDMAAALVIDIVRDVLQKEKVAMGSSSTANKGRSILRKL